MTPEQEAKYCSNTGKPTRQHFRDKKIGEWVVKIAVFTLLVCFALWSNQTAVPTPTEQGFLTGSEQLSGVDFTEETGGLAFKQVRGLTQTLASMDARVKALEFQHISDMGYDRIEVQYLAPDTMRLTGVTLEEGQVLQVVWNGKQFVEMNRLEAK